MASSWLASTISRTQYSAALGKAPVLKEPHTHPRRVKKVLDSLLADQELAPDEVVIVAVPGRIGMSPYAFLLRWFSRRVVVVATDRAILLVLERGWSVLRRPRVLEPMSRS